MRIATGAVRPRNDREFTRGVIKLPAAGWGQPALRRTMCFLPPGRCRHRPLRKRYKRRRKTGRCGERTERCRWQKKRSERVAAVKILSVRRKAAQKFWAPQQDHRPLRRGQDVLSGGVLHVRFKFVKKLSCLFGAVAVQCFRRFFASKFALHPG